jgi:hypothetical protein
MFEITIEPAIEPGRQFFNACLNSSSFEGASASSVLGQHFITVGSSAGGAYAVDA